MDHDLDEIDEADIARLYVTRHKDYDAARAWKSHDWETAGQDTFRGQCSKIGAAMRRTRIGAFRTGTN